MAPKRAPPLTNTPPPLPPPVCYPVRFYGHVTVFEENGRQVWKWNAAEEVLAVAYDNPIPGYNTPNTINLRLWAAKPVRGFDLEAFNTGDYVQAILSRQRAETISAVLYPDDRTYEGKELRLRQQYFFTSASLQDVLRRFKERHDNWEEFPAKAQFQLNDTHPVIAVSELMRLLMDEHRLGWTKAWEITGQVFAFTNHTVMPEALEQVREGGWCVWVCLLVFTNHIVMPGALEQVGGGCYVWGVVWVWVAVWVRVWVQCGCGCAWQCGCDCRWVWLSHMRAVSATWHFRYLK